MRMTLSQRFTFDAAHTLDRGEASRRVHGHTYQAEVAVCGIVDTSSGMVVDLTELQLAAELVRGRLDHRMLDEVVGLGPATLENLCCFIARELSSLKALRSVRIWRADGGECVLEIGAS